MDKEKEDQKKENNHPASDGPPNSKYVNWNELK